MFGLLFFSVPGFAQEAIPGGACSPNGSVVRSGGVVYSGTSYTMVCQGGVWVRILETDSAGNLGVKQATPQTPLDVGGELKVGVSSGLACDASREGAIRYHSTNKCMELCDGTSWDCIVVGVGCDNTPTNFEFTDLTSQAKSVQVTSEILQITGVDSGCSAVVSVEGGISPEYRVCSDSSCTSVDQDWTSSNLSMDMLSKYLQVRATTSSLNSTTENVAVKVGNTMNTWTLTTLSAGPCGANPTLGELCSDGSQYAGLSPDGNFEMYAAHCDVGMTWDGSVCNGSRTNLPWNNGNTTGHTNSGMGGANTGEGNTFTLVGMDSDSDTGGNQPHQAAQACADLTDHGQTDWYLPSTAELAIVRQNLQNTLPLSWTTGYYWSSREGSTTTATGIRNGDWLQVGASKQANQPVRCIRK